MPCLWPRPGARQHHRGEPGIGEMDRHPRRDQLRLPGLEFQRAVDARTQVEPRRAGGRVRGRCTRSCAHREFSRRAAFGVVPCCDRRSASIGDCRNRVRRSSDGARASQQVNQGDLLRASCVLGFSAVRPRAPRSRAAYSARYVPHQRTRLLDLRRPRQGMPPGIVVQHHLAVLGADRVLGEVAPPAAAASCGALVLGELVEVVALRREPDAERGVGACRRRRRGCPRSASARSCNAWSLFLIFCALGLATR